MGNYAYVAIDPHGAETRGKVLVADQSEAVRRIKEMGLFPTSVFAEQKRSSNSTRWLERIPSHGRAGSIAIPGFGTRVKPATLTVFTRQLATLIEAGMPLLRGLRILQEQQENRTMKRILQDISLAVEGGSSLAEALAAHPKVFNRLYLNMVKAGEISGALELTLKRLAEFSEKAQRIKSKVKAAMFYPCAVLVVACGVLTLMMTFVVPRFKQVFEGCSIARLCRPSRSSFWESAKQLRGTSCWWLLVS